MNRRVLIASIWFQSLWFVAVIGREQTLWLLFLGVVVTYAWSIKERVIPTRLPIIVCLGLAVDALNGQLGIFGFSNTLALGLPAWLILLWLMFSWYAVMMEPVLIRVHPLLVVVSGAVGGTLSYYAGFRFGAVTLPQGTLPMLLTVAFEWTLLSAIIVKLSQPHSMDSRPAQ